MSQSTSGLLAGLASSINPQTGKLAAGVTGYTSTTDLPTVGVTTGAMAFVSETNKLYLWNGSAWFNIAMVNQAPTAIAGNQVGYELAADGTATVITLVSTDPEGFPLTWSATTSGDTQVGTVTNTDNVFTVTPSTNEADAGTLSVTFSVTDGSNTESSTSTFSLNFYTTPNLTSLNGNLTNTAYDLLTIAQNGGYTETTPYFWGARFANNGTKFYAWSYNLRYVFEYSLATAYDFTTISYDRVAHLAGLTNGYTKAGFHISPDGQYIYVMQTETPGASDIKRFTLSTPYDVSTVSSAPDQFRGVGVGSARRFGVYVSPDGNYVYHIDSDGDTVERGTLTTPFSLQTGAYGRQKISSVDRQRDVWLSDDGLRVYMLGDVSNGTKLYQSTLSTPFDLSTASSFSESSWLYPADTYSIAGFSSDATKLWVVDYAGHIHEVV